MTNENFFSNCLKVNNYNCLSNWAFISKHCPNQQTLAQDLKKSRVLGYLKVQVFYQGFDTKSGHIKSHGLQKSECFPHYFWISGLTCLVWIIFNDMIVNVRNTWKGASKATLQFLISFLVWLIKILSKFCSSNNLPLNA